MSTRWLLEARKGDGEDAMLAWAPTLDEIIATYERLVLRFPEYGPWRAKRGDEIVTLPRQKAVP